MNNTHNLLIGAMLFGAMLFEAIFLLSCDSSHERKQDDTESGYTIRTDYGVYEADDFSGDGSYIKFRDTKTGKMIWTSEYEVHEGRLPAKKDTLD